MTRALSRGASYSTGSNRVSTRVNERRLPRLPYLHSLPHPHPLVLPARLLHQHTAPPRLRLLESGMRDEEGRMTILDRAVWACIWPFAYGEHTARRVGHWIAEQALDRHVTRLSRLISEEDDDA